MDDGVSRWWVVVDCPPLSSHPITSPLLFLLPSLCSRAMPSPWQSPGPSQSWSAAFLFRLTPCGCSDVSILASL